MKKIIEYVPIITVCLIYFGFCNLHYYYKEFNIDIYHYISNTEILLSFLPTIVLLASTLYIFAYSGLINHPDFIKRDKQIEDEEITEEKDVEKISEVIKPKKEFWSLLTTFPILLIILPIIQSCITLLLINYFKFKRHELQEVNIIYAIIFLLVIYFSSSLFKNKKLIEDNILLITIFSVFYIGIQISNYRKLDADKIKDGISNKSFVFKYNGKKTSTSKENIYIGQTQSHLFIYNVKTKNTSVFKTENIDFLTIK